MSRLISLSVRLARRLPGRRTGLRLAVPAAAAVLAVMGSAVLHAQEAQPAPPAINQADTAWMLISAALVLLMTPALAFFYGGLVRTQERTQHDDDELLGAGVRRGRLGGRRLLARVCAGERVRGRAGERISPQRGTGPAGHHPASPVHVVPGDVRHHHGRAHLWRDRRTHAVPRLPALHLRSGQSSSTDRSRIGYGAAAGCSRWVRSTSPAARSST